MLPDSHVPDVLPMAVQWLNLPHADWYADAATALIVRAADLGRTRQSLKLARVLLAVQADPRLEEKRAGESRFGFRPAPEPTSRLPDWEYDRALEQLMPLAAGTDGVQFVKLLSRLLYQAIRHSTWGGEERDGSEYSAIWRPAIEDHEQNHDWDVRDALISAVRDAAMTVTTTRPETFDEVIGLLLDGSTLHQRIGLHLLSRSTDGIEIVANYLRTPGFVDDWRFTHEMAQLLNERWDDLDEDTRKGVLDWIDAGDVSGYQQSFEAAHGRRPTDEDVERHKAIWQRDKYSYIERHLTGRHKARYEAVRAEFGDAEHADFVTWSASWMGTTGPVEQDDLATWPIDQIVDYLATWEPPTTRSWPPGPTVEGLGITLKVATTARAAEFSQRAIDFADLDPTYIRAVFDGFEDALKKGTDLNWGPILALAASVADRPFEPDVDLPDRDRDPGYRWARRHIASTIAEGLQDKPNTIQSKRRTAVWTVLERLTYDPNPTPEHEQRYGGDNMDPLTLSLNTNRAYALHVVVEYGLWCHRHLTAQGINHPLAGIHVPEMLRVLDEHLDPRTDPSLAIRAVYGRWYAWLLLLDPDWATDRAPAIFGSTHPNKHDEVAWNTYIVWTPPYDSVFRALRPWYEREIERLPQDSTELTHPTRSPHQKLGEHLTTFSWRGGDDSDLADRYFNAAPDNLAGAVTAFVGRTLANTIEVPPRIATRIQAHWDRRIDILRANPDDHQTELQAFSTWFASKKLEPDWSLTRFEEVVRLAGAPRNAKSALERLADDDIEPVTAVRILSRIVQRPNDPWANVTWREAANSIIRRAGDRLEARDDTRIVIDYFVRTGDQSFRELTARDGA
jgi:hypothetical protein